MIFEDNKGLILVFEFEIASRREWEDNSRLIVWKKNVSSKDTWWNVRVKNVSRLLVDRMHIN